MRTKLISGIVAAFLLFPVAASADDLDGIDCSYDDQLADACVEVDDDTEVLSDVDEGDDPASDDEVEAAQVLGVNQELAATGRDTWMFLAMALSLLAAGGAAVRFARRKHTASAGH